MFQVRSIVGRQLAFIQHGILQKHSRMRRRKNERKLNLKNSLKTSGH